MPPTVQPNTIPVSHVEGAQSVDSISSLVGQEVTPSESQEIDTEELKKITPEGENSQISEEVSSIIPTQEVADSTHALVDNTKENDPNVRVAPGAAPITTIADLAEQTFEGGVRAAHANGSH